MASRANRWVILQAALWGYVLIAIFSFFGSPLNEFDDVIPLLHGELVQLGLVPNLDFFSFYPPLGAYLNAAMFFAFGRSVISSRLIGALFFVSLLFLSLRLLKRLFPNRNPLVYLALLLVAVSVGAGLNVASWAGFSLSLIALLSYLMAQNLARHRFPAIAISGLLTAAATLYRINFGGYVAIVVMLDLLFRWQPAGPARWKEALAFVVPWLTGCAIFCRLIYRSNTGRAVLEFVVTAQKFMVTRGFLPLEYSPELTCFVMLPSAWFFFRILWRREALSSPAFIAAAFAFANLFVIMKCGKLPTVALIGFAAEIGSVLFLHVFLWQLERAELSLLLYYCCLLHYYLSRADWFHARWLPVAGVLLLPFLLLERRAAEFSPVSGRLARERIAYAVLLTAIIVFSANPDIRPFTSWTKNGVKLLAIRIRNIRSSDGDLVLGVDAPSTAWRTVFNDADELAALRYLRASTGNGPIFVGVGDHSRVFFNDLRAYWLAGRPIGVRRFQMETRVATEAPVQKEMISDIEQNGVRWLLLDLVAPRGDDTLAARNYRGSALLDEYIRDHFRETARFGRYAVLAIQN